MEGGERESVTFFLQVLMKWEDEDEHSSVWKLLFLYCFLQQQKLTETNGDQVIIGILFNYRDDLY